MGAQGFDGGCGGFDDVAELGVVADFEGRGVEALGVVELAGGDDASRVGVQGAFGVQLGVVVWGDDLAVFEAGWWGGGEGVG